MFTAGAFIVIDTQHYHTKVKNILRADSHAGAAIAALVIIDSNFETAFFYFCFHDDKFIRDWKNVQGVCKILFFIGA